jgi:hypothetical protein
MIIFGLDVPILNMKNYSEGIPAALRMTAAAK